MTACRLAVTLQEAGGGGGGLQSQAVFMGHISETEGEEPGREESKTQRPNECKLVTERTSLSAMTLTVAERGAGGSIKADYVS